MHAALIGRLSAQAAFRCGSPESEIGNGVDACMGREAATTRKDLRGGQIFLIFARFCRRWSPLSGWKHAVTVRQLPFWLYFPVLVDEIRRVGRVTFWLKPRVTRGFQPDRRFHMLIFLVRD